MRKHKTVYTLIIIKKTKSFNETAVCVGRATQSGLASEKNTMPVRVSHSRSPQTQQTLLYTHKILPFRINHL